ncbi:hypothetical protein [Pectobacterium polaris]|uniref:hypothetical protein n=1 Tax=Pectobacterium polaris TaxID=2042057 RepID=UPI00217577A1|nr:hypothetical protein [Pectobacterium polaris]
MSKIWGEDHLQVDTSVSTQQRRSRSSIPRAEAEIVIYSKILAGMNSMGSRMELSSKYGRTLRWLSWWGRMTLVRQKKGLLGKYLLKAMAAHVQFGELKSNMAEVVAFNKAIGNSMIIVPWLNVEGRPDCTEGWKLFGVGRDSSCCV